MIQDVIHVIEALLQFGMEKNGKGILFPPRHQEIESFFSFFFAHR